MEIIEKHRYSKYKIRPTGSSDRYQFEDGSFASFTKDPHTQTYPRYRLHLADLTLPHLLRNYVPVLKGANSYACIEDGGTHDAALLSGPSES